jgi:hypothetical protein
MNIDQQNIDMTIEYDLATPILVRQLTLNKIVTRPVLEKKQVSWKFPIEDEIEVRRPVLEFQVSADIDWESYPYKLSFPTEEVTRPVLEFQVSADIDWKAYPYNLSFRPEAKL